MARYSFILLIIVATSCYKEPILPVVPSIRFNKIEFLERKLPSEPDLLIVHLEFKDGDGDLGLSADEIDPPFNDANYFYDDNGKLLTIRSRSNPKYAYLPPYEKPYDCTNYTRPEQTIYFPAEVVDNTFTIVDTVIKNSKIYYGLADMIYFETNKNHFNIEVDFLVKNVDGSFTEFDWRANYCNQSFDGRFPRLGDGKNTLEGNLSYTMTSTGFKSLFSLKTLKLRIAIKDRALHESNVIVTPEFTL